MESCGGPAVTNNTKLFHQTENSVDCAQCRLSPNEVDQPDDGVGDVREGTVGRGQGTGRAREKICSLTLAPKSEAEALL